MRTIALIFSTFLSAALFAQRTENVEKTILYHADSHQTPEQAMMLAVEEAKILAIEEEFGKNIGSHQTNVARSTNSGGSDEYVQVRNADVHGRWIKDLADPKFGKIWYEGNRLNVEVTVKGKVREIKKASIQCKVDVLCEGIDEDNARTDFRSGNNIFLKFASPVDGYLVVYLIDSNHDAFCALPYYTQSAGAYPVKANQEYVFFSKEKALVEDRAYVEQYRLDTDKDVETDLLYVVFSPNKFTKPVDTSLDPDRPRQLKWKDFQAWLGKCLNSDDDMVGEMPIPIEIKK